MNGIPYLTGASNIINGKININRWTTSPKSIANIGSVLLTCKGTVGLTSILDGIDKVHIARQFMALKPIKIFNKFLKLIIDSFSCSLKSDATSMIPGVSREQVLSLMLALPPIKEQIRIIDYIEKLTDKIYQIDKASNDLEENIQLAKSKLLDLAIRGKLLPQNKDDEPASKLLERIRKEKESAQTTTKGKRKTVDSYIFKGEDNLYYEQIGSETKCIQDEIPFDIPNSWAWARLGSVGTVFSGGTPSTRNNDYWNGNIPWITPADLTDYNDMYISSGRKNISELGLKESSACYIPAGSVIYSSRAPIGYIVISKNEITTNQGFKSIFPAIPEMNKYIYYVLKSLTPLIKKCASGTTFKEISASSFGNVLFPIPPIQEQKRIVEYISKANNQLDSMLSE